MEKLRQMEEDNLSAKEQKTKDAFEFSKLSPSSQKRMLSKQADFFLNKQVLLTNG